MNFNQKNQTSTNLQDSIVGSQIRQNYEGYINSSSKTTPTTPRKVLIRSFPYTTSLYSQDLEVSDESLFSVWLGCHAFVIEREQESEANDVVKLARLSYENDEDSAYRLLYNYVDTALEQHLNAEKVKNIFEAAIKNNLQIDLLVGLLTVTYRFDYFLASIRQEFFNSVKIKAIKALGETETTEMLWGLI